MVFSIDRGEISTRSGFSDVSREGAVSLIRFDIFPGVRVIKVVVTIGIRPQSGVVGYWRKVNGGSL
jgi:hypothetical protein